MKNVLLVILCIITYNAAQSQIYGNGKMVEFSQSVKGLTSIDIQLNADIILDYSAEETIQIKIDENLIEHVGISFISGRLTLDQKKWIEPKQLPQIRIGSPALKRIFQGTHSTSKLVHVKANKLRLEGNVGKIIAEGQVENLRVLTSGTDLELQDLAIDEINISALEDSKVRLGKVRKIETKYKNDDRIILEEEPEEYIATEGEYENSNRLSYAPNPDLRYIEFKIRNNSFRRKHFVVVGPKKDGSTFSYGFSMFPKTNKSEKWSVGTQIFEEKKFGKRELLVTIKEEDENTVVSLFN